MKLFLDNCVHYRAGRLFPGHTVSHARDEGFQLLENGDLLTEVAARFDVFVTTDKKIRHEHNLDELQIPVVELNSLFTFWADLVALSPHFPAALAATKTHRFVSVTPDGKLELLAPRT